MYFLLNINHNNDISTRLMIYTSIHRIFLDDMPLMAYKIGMVYVKYTGL